MVLRAELARVNTPVYGRVMSDRLSKADWLAEGLRTVTTEGAAGLKVGPMSDRLGVSRGSFYWHFSDIADLRGQLLDLWRDQTTEQVIRRIETDPPAQRFRGLLRRAFVHGRGLESAVRSWAVTDAEVAAAVAEVDARRIAYIARILADVGVGKAQAIARARFVYWAYLGQPLMRDSDNAVVSERLIDQFSDLLSGLKPS